MKTWRLRMVGGPYDGHEARDTGEQPPMMWYYAGLPNGWNVHPTGARFYDESRLPNDMREYLRRFEYRIIAVLQVDYKPTALYVFDDHSTRVDYPSMR